jgi:putative spermidine/putrescine transport system permease protein
MIRRQVTRAIAIVLIALPFIPLILWSFTKNWFYPDLVPQWSLAPWLSFLSANSATIDAAQMSLGIAICTTVLALAIGVPAAYVLGRESFPGKQLVEWIVLAPLLVPPFAIALGLTIEFLFLARYGIPLYHSLAGVIVAHLIITLPYVIRLAQSNFKTQSRDLDVAAATLGASPARIFASIALPAAQPTLILAGLFAFMISMSTYLLTFLIGGGTIATLPTMLFSQISNLNRPAAAVTAIVLMTPGIIYLLIAERVLRRSKSIVDFPVN